MATAPQYFLIVKDGMTRPVLLAEYLAALGTTPAPTTPANTLTLRDGSTLTLRDTTALTLR